MTNPELEGSTDRRDFIGQLAASAVVLATTACAAAPATVAPAPAQAPPVGGTPANAPAPIVPLDRSRDPGSVLDLWKKK